MADSRKTVVARAIWNEMRGRAGIKHYFLHVEGKRSEGTFSDHRWWLEEVAETVLSELAKLDGASPPSPAPGEEG